MNKTPEYGMYYRCKEPYKIDKMKWLGNTKVCVPCYKDANRGTVG